MQSLEDSCLTLLCDNNLFCSAFPSCIIIGNIKNNKYIVNQFFMFYKSEFSVLYLAIVDIINAISEKSKKQKLILERDHLTYSFLVTLIDSKFQIALIVESNGNETFRAIFDLETWNDFINVLSELVPSTLCLDSKLSNVFEMATKSSLNDIIAFKDINNCANFLKDIKFDNFNSYETAKCLKYYREIIIIVHKLKSLYNPALDETKIKKLFQD